MFDRFNYLHCETYLLLHFYLNSFLFNYGNYTPAFTRNIKLSYSKNLSFQHIKQYIPWWETPSNKTQYITADSGSGIPVRLSLSDRKGIHEGDGQRWSRREPSRPRLPETRPPTSGPDSVDPTVASEELLEAGWEKWILHMLQEECHGPDGPELHPLGSSGMWTPVKFPLVFWGLRRWWRGWVRPP